MKMTIAIADDHTLFLEHFSELIGCLGYNVILKAKHGIDLMEQLSAQSLLPDVCIIDENTSVMDGIEATNEAN